LCHATIGIPEAWFSLEDPSGSELYVVSPHLVQPVVVSMQYLTETSPMFGADVSLDLVVSHIVQPMVVSMQSSTKTTPIFGSYASLDLVVSHLVKPVVMSMQSSTETTPIFGSDASLDLVVSHPIQPMVEEVVTPMKFSVDPTFLVLVLYHLYHVIM
jgi:hypothetical protein